MKNIDLRPRLYKVLLKYVGKTWNEIMDDYENAFFEKDILVKAHMRTLIASHVAIEVIMNHGIVRVSEYHEPLKSGDLYINPYTKRLCMVE